MAPRARTTTLSLLTIAGLAAIPLAGCITERVTASNTGRFNAHAVDPSLPRGTPITQKTIADTNAAAAANAELARTPTGRVRFEIKPLGELRYDGATLPLVSPDGRFMALQIGDAPPVEATLATAPAVARDSMVVVYDLTSPILAPVVAEPSHPDEAPLAPGMLLGRAVMAEGFLVEWPRPDGARWIGIASWRTCAVRWIVGGDDSVPGFAAHAVPVSGGDVFCALGAEDGSGWLAARITPGKAPMILSSEPAQMLIPIVSASGSSAAWIALRRGTLTVELLKGEGAKPKIIATLGFSRAASDAYGAAVSLPPPGACAFGLAGPGISPVGDDALVWLNAAQQRLNVFSAADQRTIQLPQGILSAVTDPTGLLVTEAKTLSLIQPGSGLAAGATAWRPGIKTTVLGEPIMIRGGNPQGWVGVGPVKGRSTMLRVTKFACRP
ncbi:hypothetical protein BH11PLA1_BH11PLA1_16940 [soil metagenome]